MSVTFDGILKDIKAKKFAAVYFLCGEEEYFIDQLVDAFEANVLSESEKAFNQTILYGKDGNAQNVVEAARRLPMMSERQLVLIKEAQSLSFKEDQEEKYLSYLAHPVKSTVLVFAYKHGLLDKRKKFYKELQKSAVYFESSKLYDNKIEDWARQCIAAKGLRIAENALRLLVDSIGNDLTTLNNQVDKLAINKSQGQSIEIKDVEDGVGVSKEYSVFELQNAIGEKNKSKVFKIVNYFAGNPKNGPLIMVLATLYGYFSKLYLCSVNKGASDKDLAVLLRVNPFFVKDYKLAVANYPTQKIEQVFALLAEYDLRSKGVNNGNTPEGELMKELAYKILN